MQGLEQLVTAPLEPWDALGLHLPVCPASGAGSDGLHARTPGTTLPADPAPPKGSPAAADPAGH